MGVTELEQLLIRIVGDSKDYIKSLETAQAATTKVVGVIEGVLTQLGLTFSKLHEKIIAGWEHVKKVGKEVAEGLVDLDKHAATMTKSFSNLHNQVTTFAKALEGFGVYKSALDYFKQSELSTVKLSAAIKASGQSVDTVMPSFKEFTNQMKEQLATSSLETQRLLQLATTYGATGDKAKALVQAALGMAQVRGGGPDHWLLIAKGIQEGNVHMLYHMRELRGITDANEKLKKGQELVNNAWKVALESMNTLDGMTKRYTVTVNTAMRQFGAMIAEIEKPWLAFKTMLVKTFTDFDDVTRRIVVSVLGIGVAILSINPTLVLWQKWLGPFVNLALSGFTTIGHVIMGLLNPITLVTGALRVLVFTLSPVNLLIVATAAAGALLVRSFGGLAQTWEMLKTVGASVWGRIKGVILETWATVRTTIGSAVEWITAKLEENRETLETIAAVATGVATSIAVAFKLAWDVVMSSGGSVLQATIDGLIAVKDWVIELVQANAELAQTIAGVAIAVIAGIAAWKLLNLALGVTLSVSSALGIQQTISLAIWLAYKAVLWVAVTAVSAYNVALFMLNSLLALTNVRIVASYVAVAAWNAALFLVQTTTLALRAVWLASWAAMAAVAAVFMTLWSVKVAAATAVESAWNAVKAVGIVVWAGWKVAAALGTLALAAFNAMLTATGLTLGGFIAAILAGVAAVGLLVAGLTLIASVGAGAWAAVMGVVQVLQQLPTTYGPVAYVGELFGEWYSILRDVWKALQTDIPLAGKLVSAAFTLAVEQVKALWPPLWGFVKAGFSVLWDVVSAQFELAFTQMLNKVTQMLVGVWKKIPGMEMFLRTMGLDNIDEIFKSIDTQLSQGRKAVMDRAGQDLKKSVDDFTVTETEGIKKAREEVDKLRKEVREPGTKESAASKYDKPIEAFRGMAAEAKHAREHVEKLTTVLWGSAHAWEAFTEQIEMLKFGKSGGGGKHEGAGGEAGEAGKAAGEAAAASAATVAGGAFTRLEDKAKDLGTKVADTNRKLIEATASGAADSSIKALADAAAKMQQELDAARAKMEEAKGSADRARNYALQQRALGQLQEAAQPLLGIGQAFGGIAANVEGVLTAPQSTDIGRMADLQEGLEKARASATGLQESLEKITTESHEQSEAVKEAGDELIKQQAAVQAAADKAARATADFDRWGLLDPAAAMRMLAAQKEFAAAAERAAEAEKVLLERQRQAGATAEQLAKVTLALRDAQQQVQKIQADIDALRAKKPIEVPVKEMEHSPKGTVIIQEALNNLHARPIEVPVYAKRMPTSGGLLTETDVEAIRRTAVPNLPDTYTLDEYKRLRDRHEMGLKRDVIQERTQQGIQAIERERAAEQAAREAATAQKIAEMRRESAARKEAERAAERAKSEILLTPPEEINPYTGLPQGVSEPPRPPSAEAVAGAARAREITEAATRRIADAQKALDAAVARADNLRLGPLMEDVKAQQAEVERLEADAAKVVKASRPGMLGRNEAMLEASFHADHKLEEARARMAELERQLEDQRMRAGQAAAEIQRATGEVWAARGAEADARRAADRAAAEGVRAGPERVRMPEEAPATFGMGEGEGAAPTVAYDQPASDLEGRNLERQSKDLLTEVRDLLKQMATKEGISVVDASLFS